ncbi:MAG: NAD-binding protein [Oscillibacter sp.]|nr:NAD-binding protein [Oscillibacter sp.]
MKQIGFLGLGVMGLPMAKNLVKKAGCPVLGYDVLPGQMESFQAAGGVAVENPLEIYQSCDIIFQILPTHPIIIHSVEQAIQYGNPGRIVVDLSSTAPDIILDLFQKAQAAGISLVDAPVSGGNPMAETGTLAIMAGGEQNAFETIEPLLSCMGTPVYTGGPASGSVTKLVNNMIGGATLVAIAEGYAFAAKAGINLQTTFEATRGGFAGGPLYDNKVPKLIRRDYEPGARIAVHRKDILNAKHYAHQLGVDLPMTDVVLHIMDWMSDNGHIDEDQIAMVQYYEEKMNITVGQKA